MSIPSNSPFLPKSARAWFIYSYADFGKLEILRNYVNIRWKWTHMRFTLPISTLDTKVLSIIRCWKNGATNSVDCLEASII